MKKIFKITLTADNGVFKYLIHDISHAMLYNKELEKFKIIFLAKIIETQIIITEKKGFKVIPETGSNYNSF